jgi:two-component sensor histidine kinase
MAFPLTEVRAASSGLGSAFSHFGDLVGKRILFDGPPIRVSSAAAQSIGMVVHELSTNTVKYGALSGEEGRIDIGWRIDSSSGAEPVFSICWTEVAQDVEKIAGTNRGYTRIYFITNQSDDCVRLREYEQASRRPRPHQGVRECRRRGNVVRGERSRRGGVRI